jgi:transposase
MTEITRVGVDLAKSVFQLHGIDAEGAVGPCLVGMEACAGAHHWARELAKFGLTSG